MSYQAVIPFPFTLLVAIQIQIRGFLLIRISLVIVCRHTSKPLNFGSN
jgi:hypothetical protein